MRALVLYMTSVLVIRNVVYHNPGVYHLGDKNRYPNYHRDVMYTPPPAVSCLIIDVTPPIYLLHR